MSQQPHRSLEASRTSLIAWLTLAIGLAVVSYAARAADSSDRDTRELLYQYSTAVAGLIQYTFILAILAAIARRIDRKVIGFVGPPSWRRAGIQVLATLAAAWAIGVVLNLFLKAGDEQGLTPDHWEGARAGAFLANAVVIVVVAPFVEELMYRGVGFVAIRSAAGATAAIAGTAVLFGLGHGLVVALPMLAIFGALLAILRQRTASLYPSMAAHALFNGVALLAAVTIGGRG